MVIPGCPHHVTRRASLVSSTERATTVRSKIRFDLMADHAHLVATPKRGDSLAKPTGRTNLHDARHVVYWAPSFIYTVPHLQNPSARIHATARARDCSGVWMGS